MVAKLGDGGDGCGCDDDVCHDVSMMVMIVVVILMTKLMMSTSMMTMMMIIKVNGR